MNEKQKYASYNVMARKGLMFGIPIITLVIFVCLIMITGFGGIVLFDLKGLIMPLILIVILFGIRFQCESDSRAMEAVWWDLKGVFYRVRCKSNVTSFTSSPVDSPSRRKENVREWLKNNTNH
ncbi:hypothetical protein KFE26_21495 [Shewanella sp. M16]|uniref:hypothetical protein n=1 Tax=Shewanella sp. M16 TaxID=2830837 RepID=UPI001BAF081B|nr:hypothetical protein [Shewanella sp. M16]MBS0044845.1 hypothetical protein [Shewanella sp. M16]